MVIMRMISCFKVCVDLKTLKELTRIKSNEEELLKEMPVKFLTTEDAMIATSVSGSIIYKIEFWAK